MKFKITIFIILASIFFILLNYYFNTPTNNNSTLSDSNILFQEAQQYSIDVNSSIEDLKKSIENKNNKRLK